MKRIIIFIVIFIVFCHCNYALAEDTDDDTVSAQETAESTEEQGQEEPVESVEPSGEPTEEQEQDTSDSTETATDESTFAIDTQHVYSGMDKSYAQGYMPSGENGSINVVLPLIISGDGLCDTVTASLDLGDPSTAPFVFKNYVNDFALGNHTIEGGESSCYLVHFCLELNEDRINGSYPVVISVSGKTQEGDIITNTFTLYAVIQDGGESDVEPTPEPTSEPTPEPTILLQPKLIVDSYVYNANPLEAGADGTMTIIVKNTSTLQSVENIKLSFEDQSGEILPKEKNAVYIEKIDKGDTASYVFDIRVIETAAPTPHKITITMEYEDSQAVSILETDTIILDVMQPIRLEYEQPSLPTKATEGDNLSFSMNIMNLGKGTVYNVLLTFEIPGMNNGGSVLVGNLESGESKEATTNLKVSSIDGEYGDTSGTILLSYENEEGELFERKIDVQTRIDEKIEAVLTETEESEDKNEDSFPWWAWGVGGIVVTGAAGVAIVKILKSKRQREIDERRL